MHSPLGKHVRGKSTTETSTAVTRKELERLKRSELVDLVQELSEGGQVDISVYEALSSEQRKARERQRFKSLLMRTVGALVVIAAAAVLVSTLLFPVVQVSGTSMQPTFEQGDVLVLSKLGGLEAGDLVSFNWQNRLLIKRVIAGPGDVVSIDADGVVSVNGEELDEPYVDELALGSCDISFPYQVPENRYFVLGDHRATSIDSRSSEIGCVEEQQVVGKVILRVLPLSSFSFLG